MLRRRCSGPASTRVRRPARFRWRAARHWRPPSGKRWATRWSRAAARCAITSMQPASRGPTSSCTRRYTKNQANPAPCVRPPYGASSRASAPATSVLNANGASRNSLISNALHINKQYDMFFLINGDLPMSKQFASHADLADKVVSFEKLSDNAYAYTELGSTAGRERVGQYM